MMKEDFKEQVNLLLKCLPIINNEDQFVLTGGTAINLFLRDMPRFSVDIDLLWKFVSDRKTALDGISNSLIKIENNLIRVPGINKVIPKQIDNKYIKLNVFSGKTAIKIEVSDVGRGCFLPIEKKQLCKTACEEFKTKLYVDMAAYEEIYAGKIRATLDRQHPRDMFDIKILLDNEGITDKLMDSVVIYLIQGNRPFHEFLAPNLLDRKNAYKSEFVGMSNKDYTYDELIEVKDTLVKIINSKMTDKHKEFIISFYEFDSPKWGLCPIEGIEDLPATKWKLKNIEKMGTKNKLAYAEKLRTTFS